MISICELTSFTFLRIIGIWYTRTTRPCFSKVFYTRWEACFGYHWRNCFIWSSFQVSAYQFKKQFYRPACLEKPLRIYLYILSQPQYTWAYPFPQFWHSTVYFQTCLIFLLHSIHQSIFLITLQSIFWRINGILLLLVFRDSLAW